MGNYEVLKEAIKAVIKENGNNEITGNVLQNVLLTMINSISVGSVFMGQALPNTVPSNTDAKSFYIAGRNGTYVNFGGYELENKIVVFLNVSGLWKPVEIWLGEKYGGFYVSLKNKGLIGINGNITINNAYDLSDLINVVENDTIIYSGIVGSANHCAIAGYNINKEFVRVLLGNGDFKNKIVNIPNDIAYIRISCANLNDYYVSIIKDYTSILYKDGTLLTDKVNEVSERTAGLDILNCDNMLKWSDFNYNQTNDGNVAFDYIGDGKYHVHGKSINEVSCNFYLDRTKLPNVILPGRKYQMLYKSEKVYFFANEYRNNEYVTGVRLLDNGLLNIEYGIEGLIIGLNVPANTDVDEIVYPILIYNYTSDQIKEILDTMDDMGTVTATGNPVLLNDTSQSIFKQLDFSILSDDTLIMLCNKNTFMITSDMVKRIDNGNTYNFVNNTINVISEGSTANSVSSGENFGDKYRYINGKEWYHNFKFKFANDTWVTVSAECNAEQTYDFKAQLQVSDGTLNLYVDGNGLTFKALANTEYGIRLFVSQGFKGDVTFYPQVEIGTHKTAYEPIKGGRYIKSNIGDYTLFLSGSKLGKTMIYTDNNAQITATAYKQKKQEQINTNKEAGDKLNMLCAYKKAFAKNIKPVFSFIDDDTSSVALVERYYNIFANKGVVGGYAIMTKNLDEQAGLKDLLLQYEQAGFSCLYHCYYQRGDETRYWESGNPMYNEELIKENFMKGLREINQFGFLNYKYWVTPYGVDDEFIRSLAKTHGMECLLTLSGTLSNNSFVSIAGNADRYNIPRISLSTGTNMQRFYNIIDGCIADNGFGIIVTHANTWGSSMEMDEKVSDVIQYILDNGGEIKSFPECYENYKSSFYFNELF